ncbi:phage portal protein [Nocardia sp. NPDC005366]|uniref:phage portal protein n=1 Tax=Nocardia sp. NPDC005366 TaxID=3156878 RepID=UPI0033AA680F
MDSRDEYLKAESYYNGTVEEIFASPKIRKALEASGDSDRINYAATPVNAVANRLEVTGVTTLSDQAGAVIDRTWETNNLELELTQLFVKTLVYGSAYLTVWPDASGETQVYYNSPLSTTVLYDPENPRRAIVGAKLWSAELADGTERHRLNLYYPDRTERYLSKAERLPFRVRDVDFEPYGEDWLSPNPFGEIPVFHFTTGQDQYGRPEHTNAYAAQNAINKLLISQLASVEYYGFPTRYAINGEGGTQSDFSDDDDGTDAGSLSTAPGMFQHFSNVSKVGQFEAAKPGTYIDPYKEYVRAMASVTDTPFHVFEAVATNVSGEAVRGAEAPLVKKVRVRQLSIGHVLRKMFIFVLKLNGITEDVQIQWRQIESIDTSERWSINKKKVEAGLPVRQMLIEDGYDTTLIDKWEQAGLLPEFNTTEIERVNND